MRPITALFLLSITVLSMLLVGCGVTVSSARPVLGDSGRVVVDDQGMPIMACHSTTFTIWKDVAGARMQCGTGTGWSVDSSDPNAAAANLINTLTPYTLAGIKAAVMAPVK